MKSGDIRTSIGKIAVTENGYIFEITNVILVKRSELTDYEFKYVGVDIFSGNQRESYNPVFLNRYAVRSLTESMQT